MTHKRNLNPNSSTNNQALNPISPGQNANSNISNKGKNTGVHYSNSNNSGTFEEKEDKKRENLTGKFTCRFEIQIENDKEFQVARRLIGAKVNT